MEDIFTQVEWEMLKATPKIVVNYIGKADDKLDKKEIEAFGKFCNAKRQFKSDLFKAVLPDNPNEYLNEPYESAKNADIFRELDATLDLKFDPVDGRMFKHHLMALGVHIANASGKLFQHTISDVEDEALYKLGRMIDVDASQLFRTTLVDDILKNVE